jgi:drug/metabolite transporter (DMT)-like permease
MKIKNNPRLRLFIGAALISLSPIWVRLVDVSPTTSGFYRVLFGSVVLVVYLLVLRKRVEFSKQAWLVLTVAALFLALDLWFWHRSIDFIGPGLATLLANFQVFIMMIAGFLFLKQTPRLKQLVAVPMALVGLALIVGLDWNNLPADYRLGVVFGLLTAVVYAGYLLSLRQARQYSSYRVPTREIAVVSVICTVMMAASIIAEGETLVIPSYPDVGWLLAYGVLSHSLGGLFIASSLPQVTAAEAGLALLSQPTLSFIWDVVFFDRPMTSLELLGAFIALAAIYLGSRRSSKQI